MRSHEMKQDAALALLELNPTVQPESHSKKRKREDMEDDDVGSKAVGGGRTMRMLEENCSLNDSGEVTFKRDVSAKIQRWYKDHFPGAGEVL